MIRAGKNYFVMTPTFYFLGKVIEDDGKVIKMNEVSLIYSTGDLSHFLLGDLSNPMIDILSIDKNIVVEIPYWGLSDDELKIASTPQKNKNRKAVVMMTEWNHPLPYHYSQTPLSKDFQWAAKFSHTKPKGDGKENKNEDNIYQQGQND